MIDALPVFLCKLNPIKTHWETDSWTFSSERSATYPPQADHVLVDVFSSVVARGALQAEPPHKLSVLYFFLWSQMLLLTCPKSTHIASIEYDRGSLEDCLKSCFCTKDSIISLLPLFKYWSMDGTRKQMKVCVCACVCAYTLTCAFEACSISRWQNSDGKPWHSVHEEI